MMCLTNIFSNWHGDANMISFKALIQTLGAIIEVKIYNIKKANNSKFGFFTLFLKYHHNYDYTHVFTRKWNDFIFEYESNIK